MNNTNKTIALDYLDELWIHYQKQVKAYDDILSKDQAKPKNYWDIINKMAAITQCINEIS